jgi:putative membrane protein
MKTLVLCVDRDDDFGEKLAVNTPIVGRRNNIETATAMLLEDPEESDANALFGALKIYDELVCSGEKAEIVTICGGRQVNPTTDRKLFKELEMALYISNAKEVILVTDGSEDEYILPIIGSRVNIISKKRIIVKQSDKLESFYFYFTKILEDEKTKRIVVPLALIFMFGGITTLMGIGNVGYGAVAVLIGLYLFMKTYHLEHPLKSLVADVQKNSETGLPFIFSILALIIILAGLASFVDGMNELDEQPAGADPLDPVETHEWNPLRTEFYIAFLDVAQDFIILITLAVIIWRLGKSFSSWMAERSFPWLETNRLLFYIAATLFLNACLEVIRSVTAEQQVQYTEFLKEFIIGLLFFFSWWWAHNAIENRSPAEPASAGWRK